MNNPDLRALFTVGATTRLSAEEVFINRISELQAFQLALPKFMQWKPARELSPVMDVTEPRTNVLTFYGIGGIGKTALSRHLEQDLLEKMPKDRSSSLATVRIDFEDSASLDLESVVLRLRAGLANLAPKWPAFDIAFAVYWERSHPGEPLKEFIKSNSMLRRMARKARLSKQMEDAVCDLANAIGMPSSALSTGGGVAKAVYDQIATNVASRRLFNHCPFFKPLIEADANDDTLSYLPSLLSWELEIVQTKNSTLAVVFLDTFEAVTNRSTRDLERFIQRIIFLMPNVLFLITGRNRLDWAEIVPPAELDYVGIPRWPQLSMKNRDTEPRQHLVGFLSPTDCDEYLRLALTRDRVSAMDHEIRARITEASAGLPLYLDLSVDYYCDIVGSGQTPTVQDFGGPLPTVVIRIMRDMNSHQRSLLRGASLLETFDEELVLVAAGSVPDAAAIDFVARPFVQHAVDHAWPYTLHALLRNAVRTSDHQLKDSWSTREWKTSAERICEHLGELSDELREINDRPRLVGCFLNGVRLASEFDLTPSWIFDIGNRLSEMGAWTALDIPSFGTDDRPIASALRAGFRGIALRRIGSLDDSIAELELALASPELNSEAMDVFVLHHAHSVRNSGRYDQAEEIYRRILGQGGRFQVQAQVQLADIHLLRGRFETALKILEHLPADSFMRGEALRIHGHTYRVNAQFAEAESSYRQVIELARSIKSLALEGKALTNLVETYCWRRPEEALSLADDAIDFNTRVGNRLELIKAHAAKAVAEHGVGAAVRAQESINTSLDLASATGYRAGAIFAWVAYAFQAILSARDKDALDSYSRIGRIIANIGVYEFWTEIVGWWLKARQIGDVRQVEPAQWILGEDRTNAAWSKILTDRL